MKLFIKQQLVTAGAIMLAMAVPASAETATESVTQEAATVTVDFDDSRGDFLHPERYNNFTRWGGWQPQRDADILFLNEQGLHGEIYKVWVDAERIHDPETDTYDYTITLPTQASCRTSC